MKKAAKTQLRETKNNDNLFASFPKVTLTPRQRIQKLKDKETARKGYGTKETKFKIDAFSKL